MKCPNCEGDGKVLLMNTMFTDDGYRKERCGICGGSGEAPSDYHAWPGHAEFLKRAKENIAKWGGRLVPIKQ